MIAVHVDDVQFRRFEAILKDAPKKAIVALQRAVNRAATKAATESKRVISRELGIKQSDLTKPHRFGSPSKFQSTGKAIDTIKAGKDKLEAKVRIAGRRIPVVYFKPNPRDARRPVKGGVQFKIGAHGVTRVKNAFVGRARSGSSQSAAEGTSGHVGVWKRVGKSRLPIQELLGPSIPYAAEKNADLKRAIDVDVQSSMSAELDRQLDLIAREWNAK